MQGWKTGRVCSALAVVGLAAFAARSAHAGKFFIDEETDYSRTCVDDMDNLSATTKGLADNLTGRNWTGGRYLNADAWPQDFTESCSTTYGSGGLDHNWADAADLAVFSGHGNTGMVGFGAVDNGMCMLDLGSTSGRDDTGVARLGSMAGARASIAIWLTCCTLKKDRLVGFANRQWVKQHVGFHGMSAFTADMVSAYARNSGAPARVGDISNREAWMVAMEDEPGWFTGDNSPIVVSYGSTSAEANSNHSSLDLDPGHTRRAGGPTCGNGPPKFFYVYTVIDNGSEGCNP